MDPTPPSIPLDVSREIRKFHGPIALLLLPFGRIGLSGIYSLTIPSRDRLTRRCYIISYNKSQFPIVKLILSVL